MNSPDHHLDPEAIIALGRGELGEARRRLLAPHLADCDECLEQVAAVALLIAARSEQAAAETADGHISAEHLRGLALGTLGPVTNEHVRGHVAGCEHCADALDAVMVMRRRQSRRRWARTALAVASVAAVAILAARGLSLFGDVPARPVVQDPLVAQGRPFVQERNVSMDGTEAFLATVTPGRLNSVEALVFRSDVLVTREFVGLLAPTNSSDAGRHAQMLLGLDAILDNRLGDAAVALERFRNRAHPIGTPLLGLVEYASGVPLDRAESTLRLGVVIGGRPSQNSRVAMSLWVLGKIAAGRGDNRLAREQWLLIRDDPTSLGRLARAALATPGLY